MSTRLVLIADTHLPQRVRGLHPSLWTELEAADVVFHAGDWVEPALLDELERRCKKLVAVYGNNDGAELRARLPEIAHVRIEGLSFSMIHETGASAGREKRCTAKFPDADVLVFGHSHIPWDSTAASGLRLLNPGSPTDRRRQPVCTYMSAVVEDGTLGEVSVIPVERVGA